MALQSTDPIADLLTRIRNAIMAGKTEVRVPASKMKLTVAQQLQKAGYLSKVTTEKGTPRDPTHQRDSARQQAWTPCLRRCRRHPEDQEWPWHHARQHFKGCYDGHRGPQGSSRW